MEQFEILKKKAQDAQEVFKTINDLIASAEDDAIKYYDKGTRSAGNRLKKKMQEIRKAIKMPAIRLAMVEVQNAAKDYRNSLTEELKAPAKEEAETEAKAA